MTIGDDGRDIGGYLLLLIPLEVVMTSRRVVKDGNRTKQVMLAGALLALVASVKLGLELSNKEQSYYDMMGVLPTATPVSAASSECRRISSAGPAFAEKSIIPGS